MSPSIPPEPATAPLTPFDPNALPPKLRRLYDSARRLAALKAERDSWVKTALALEFAELEKPAADQPAPADSSDRDDCGAESP